MDNYNKLLTAKGYYCYMCDTYHTDNEMLHRYTIETVGEWCGQPATEKSHEMLCPNCHHTDEIEDFDRYLWSHLVAYQRATGVPMVFECPIFDRDTNGPTTGYEWVATADEVEEKADWYAIEVEDIRYDAEGIVVRLDFQ